MEIQSRSKLSEAFIHLEGLCSAEKVIISNVFESLSDRSHALPALIFSVPFFLPVPVPGLSVLLGLVIMISGIGLSTGKKPWFPKRWAGKSMGTGILRKISYYGIKISSIVEKITVPTKKVIKTCPIWLHQIAGVFISVCGFLLALPLPPGTNFPPALAIFFLSLGVLEDNLVLIIVGFLTAVLNGAIFYIAFNEIAKLLVSIGL